MPPIMRIFLPVIGIFVAASIGSPANRAFDLVVGAAVGFAIAELGIVRMRLNEIAQDIVRLTTELRRRQTVPSTSAAPPEAPRQSIKPPELPKEAQPAKTSPEVILRRPWQDIEPPRNSEVAHPAVPRPAAPPPSYMPAPEHPFVAAIRNFFTGGNTLVRIGVIVLFFGVAFLLRYLAEHTHVPIELRLSGIALFRSRCWLRLALKIRRGTGYALALQGGGVGILYLIVFSALRLVFRS